MLACWLKILRTASINGGIAFFTKSFGLGDGRTRLSLALLNSFRLKSIFETKFPDCGYILNKITHYKYKISHAIGKISTTNINLAKRQYQVQVFRA